MTKNGVYLISPSSAISDLNSLDRAIVHLRGLGYEVVEDQGARLVHERFAGTDEQRIAAVHRAIRQEHKLVMVTRGGYGLSRILPYIDWQAVAASSKIFIGLSDFTAFNLALLAKTGAISYSGPTAVFDFGAALTNDFTISSFQRALAAEPASFGFAAPGVSSVRVCGTLWGGNLAMLVSLLGTEYFPQIDGGILFLEDVCEHPFRIERMFSQLLYAGILQRQQAVVLGEFTGYRLAAHDNGYDLGSALQWLRNNLRVPVITGLPYGHTAKKLSLPVGAQAELVANAGQANLKLPARIF